MSRIWLGPSLGPSQRSETPSQGNRRLDSPADVGALDRFAERDGEAPPDVHPGAPKHPAALV
jgi:hypothetical protein